jgi:hypothetical protein
MAVVQSAFGALAITGGTVTGTITVVEPTAATTGYAAQVTGDTNPRFTIGADGKHNWGGGSGATDTDLYRVAANILQTDGTFQVLTNQNVGGNLAVITAGNGLQIKEGSNAKMGTAVLVAGSAVVANTATTAVSRIHLTSQVDGGTPGFLRVSTRTAGTSFTITSSSATDTSTVAYLIVEPN